MFEARNYLVFAAVLAWCLLFAGLATVSSKRTVAPRLEAQAREALPRKAAFADLKPRFRGFTGWFSGTVPTTADLQEAQTIVANAVPVHRFHAQSGQALLAAPEPSSTDPAASATASHGDKPAPASASEPSPPADAVPESLPVALTTENPPLPNKEHPRNEGSPEPEPDIAASNSSPPPARTPPVAPPAAPAAPPSEPKNLAYVPEEWDEDWGQPGEAPADPESEEPASTPPEIDEWAATIQFQSNSSQLSEKARRKLRSIVESSRERPDQRLHIVSYSDPRGDRAFNTWLGERRAHRIRRELSRMGASLDMEVYVEFEESSSPRLELPKVERRVEIRFVR